ncbi:MAG: hypothetical protein HOF38_04710 [Elusimicrobiaceae bacterium]|jgi:Leucine-rich repeat (LRR) protein|nr:hypothetical protein [Elusimicrobiaceae bacterium]MBT3955437.1 hypothetical protein [Elusimicrobiaceae bacterium]MBT4008194.1 hypothetical protein [Elusimicrobiaceae bacterium]MBT4402506.1 hypothetical protein [Elusimicrobiaceae bacterium]MBT4439633.1 hypothetical protein [Elusimicrobiaceae bacterium]
MIKKILIIAMVMLSFLIGKTNLFAETNIENKVISMIEQNATTCKKYYGTKYFAKKKKRQWLSMLYTDSACTKEFKKSALEIDNARIKDLTPLAGLTNLIYLYLFNNKIEDLTPLAGLINLKTLYLSSNKIKDLTPLAKLINLEKLYLGNNKVKKINILAGLINLRYLNLSNNQITDLGPIFGLINLETVYTKGNPIEIIQITK